MQSHPVTIVIPTHFRHALLAVALEQYAESGLPVLVVDSTDVPLDPAILNGQVDYRHLPGLGFLDKLHLAVHAVRTPCLVMRADNRFLDPEAVLACADFLEAHPDHASAQGLWVTATELPHRLALEPKYHLGQGLAASTGQERLREMFDPYVPSFYAVQRTQNWRDALDLAQSGLTNLNALELFVAMHAAICGRHARLPLLYAVGLDARRVSGKSAAYEDFSLVASLPRYAGEFARFLAGLAKTLAARDGLPLARAEASVRETVALHLSLAAASPGPRPLWRKAPKYLRRAAEAVVPGLAHRRLGREARAEDAVLAQFLSEAGPDAPARLERLLKLCRSATPREAA
jgi:glycosyltransferase domain-containing protein